MIIRSYASGSVSGTRRVGGLVGSNDERGGAVVGSHATGTVSGTISVGGLAGGNWNTIIGSYATGDVSGDRTIGGLAGSNSGSIGTSYAIGNVSGNRTVGGLVGDNNSAGVIVWSYATGIVSGGSTGSRVGGLVGSTSGSSAIISSYALGVVSGRSGIGGLVGYNSDRGVIIGSYATGRVSGTYVIGGLAGWNDRSNGIFASYWDIESSGQSQGVGGGFASGAEGKATAELQARTSYAGIYRDWDTDIDDADGDSYEVTSPDDPWDFGKDDQYPTLREYFDGDVAATWDPPVAEGGTVSFEASSFVEHDALVVVEVGEPVNGRASLNGLSITYTHDGTETTTDNFSYTVIDDFRASIVTLTFPVTLVNDPPEAAGELATVAEGDTLTLEASALLDNDTDAEDDTLTITAVGDAVNGRVSLYGTAVTYTHDGSDTTTGSFSYTVSDGSGTVTTTVEIAVTPVGDLPVEVDDVATATAPTPGFEATASPTLGILTTPTTLPDTTPKSTLPPPDAGGMNVVLIVLIFVLGAAIASGVTVIVMSRRNLT